MIVSADKNVTVQLGLCIQEAVNGGSQLIFFDGLLHSRFRRNAGFQLRQREDYLSVSAFFGSIPLITVQSEIARDFP